MFEYGGTLDVSIFRFRAFRGMVATAWRSWAAGHEGTLDQLREGHSGPYLWTLRVLDWLPWSGSLWREMLLTAGLQGAEYAKSEYNLRNFYLDSTKEGSGD